MPHKIVVLAIAVDAASRRRMVRRLGYQCEISAVDTLERLRTKVQQQPELANPQALIVGGFGMAIHNVVELRRLFPAIPIVLLTPELELKSRLQAISQLKPLDVIMPDDIDRVCEVVKRIAIEAPALGVLQSAAKESTAAISPKNARWSDNAATHAGSAVGWLLLSAELRVIEADHIASRIVGQAEPLKRGAELIGLGLFEIVPLRFRPELEAALAELKPAADPRLEDAASSKSGRFLANLSTDRRDLWCEFLLYRQSLPDALDDSGSEIAILLRETIKPARKQLLEPIAPSYELSIGERAASKTVAGIDPLTGLSERRPAMAQLDAALDEARQNDSELVVACINVRQLGFVNHECGIDTGDAVLRELALRLQNLLNRSKIVARLGGDEFLVVLRGCESAQQSGRLLMKALDSVLAYPFSTRAGSLQLQLSAGLAAFPTHGATSMRLLSSAALALRRARFDQSRSGAWYNRSDQNLSLPLSTLHRGLGSLSISPETLRAALRQNQLELHYQPIVLASNPKSMHSVEALLRWPMQGRALNPADLIHLAERGGFINDLGAWVIETACERLALWRRSAPDLGMNINLSALQLASGSVVTLLKRTLHRHKLPATAITLEITENYDLEALEYAESSLNLLRDTGFSLALDDFGSGFARLQYLQKYPFDTLKIDRSFVSQLVSDRSSKPVVAGLVQIAQGFGLKTVGEGAETAQEAVILEELGCDYLQGYYSGRPTDRRELPLF